MIRRHRTADPRLDGDGPEVPQPVGPEPREPSDNRTLCSPVNGLESQSVSRHPLPAAPADGRRARPGHDIDIEAREIV